MKILKNSIKEISSEFDKLEELLDDANYVVSILAKTFHYELEDDKPFTIENLKFIFSKEKNTIKGELQNITWDKTLKKISQYLSYATYLHSSKKDESSGFRIVSQDKLQERNDILWNSIKKYTQIPPKEVIEHIPVQPSYFGDFLIWGFCYIFLSNGKGVVIYCWAED